MYEYHFNWNIEKTKISNQKNYGVNCSTHHASYSQIFCYSLAFISSLLNNFLPFLIHRLALNRI